MFVYLKVLAFNPNYICLYNDVCLNVFLCCSLGTFSRPEHNRCHSYTRSPNGVPDLLRPVDDTIHRERQQWLCHVSDGEQLYRTSHCMQTVLCPLVCTVVVFVTGQLFLILFFVCCCCCCICWSHCCDKVSVYGLVYNYTHVEDSKVSVSIKRTYAKQCTLSEIFVSEILNRFSAIYSGLWYTYFLVRKLSHFGHTFTCSKPSFIQE